jgi:hypothetical protein
MALGLRALVRKTIFLFLLLFLLNLNLLPLPLHLLLHGAHVDLPLVVAPIVGAFLTGCRHIIIVRLLFLLVHQGGVTMIIMTGEGAVILALGVHDEDLWTPESRIVSVLIIIKAGQSNKAFLPSPATTKASFEL